MKWLVLVCTQTKTGTSRLVKSRADVLLHYVTPVSVLHDGSPASQYSPTQFSTTHWSRSWRASPLKSDKSSQSCAKIALHCKNCATAGKRQNWAVALRKIPIFRGGGVYHHHHQFNTHECSMNNKIYDRAHTIIQKDKKKTDNTN